MLGRIMEMVLNTACRKLIHIIQSHLLLFLLHTQTSIISPLIEQINHLSGHEVLLVIKADLVRCSCPELLSLTFSLLIVCLVAMLIYSIVEDDILYFAV